MKGDKKVIQHLNKVLANELTCDQPVLPARAHVRQLGPAEARGVREEESIDEMKHADRLIERIFSSKGCRICRTSAS
jgi:bacterioferritin